MLEKALGMFTVARGVGTKDFTVNPDHRTFGNHCVDTTIQRVSISQVVIRYLEPLTFFSQS